MPRQTQNLGANHYATVAAALRAELDHAEHTYRDRDGEGYRAHRYAVQCMAQRLADIYTAAASPSRLPFDRMRFLTAAGVMGPDATPAPYAPVVTSPDDVDDVHTHCPHCPEECATSGTDPDCGHCIDGCCT